MSRERVTVRRRKESGTTCNVSAGQLVLLPDAVFSGAWLTGSTKQNAGGADPSTTGETADYPTTVSPCRVKQPRA
jgi:hypothetical protein